MRQFRKTQRAVRLAAACLRGAFRIVVLRRDPCESAHLVARDIVDLMNLRLRVSGEVPESGLIVCNHLGYLDVIVLAATCPTIFVAKSEVRRWPAFGWFARRMGCIFAERGRPVSAGRSAEAIRQALASGRRVVLFPEGTSSGGGTVLPFRSSLLEPAVGSPMTVAAVGYALDAGDGDASREVCYWGDMTFLPHLLRLLGKRRIHARLSFASCSGAGLDRKDLAIELHRCICRLLGAPYRPEAIRGAGLEPAGLQRHRLPWIRVA
jgi:1-acyl-sn-glycerol-3-phosphate acyltransferase